MYFRSPSDIPNWMGFKAICASKAMNISGVKIKAGFSAKANIRHMQLHLIGLNIQQVSPKPS